VIDDIQSWIGVHAADLEGIATLWFVVLAVACIPAGLYILHIYRQRYEEAPFLTRLVLRDIRVWLGAMLLLVLVAAALAHLVSRPWGTLTICAAVTVFIWGLLDDAVVFYRERKRRDL
jgi:hypothetical protein